MRSRAPLSSATLSFVLLSTTGCMTSRVTEGSIYQPVAAGALTGAAVTAVAPAYKLEPQAIVARDGATLRGVWLRQPGAKRTVLFFGGNGFVVEKGAPAVKLFAALGVDVMMVDHRGYGTSDADGGGSKIETLMTDGEDVFDSLAARTTQPIVLHGHSLGSFVAGHVAAVREAGGVVLQSSATNADDFVRGRVPGIARPFVRVEIAPGLKAQGNLAVMPRIAEPVLLIVGADDTTTAPAMSRRLYDASPLPPGRKTLAVVTGVGHNDVFAAPEAVAAYRAFLQSLSR